MGTLASLKRNQLGGLVHSTLGLIPLLGATLVGVRARYSDKYGQFCSQEFPSVTLPAGWNWSDAHADADVLAPVGLKKQSVEDNVGRSGPASFRKGWVVDKVFVECDDEGWAYGPTFQVLEQTLVRSMYY